MALVNPETGGPAFPRSGYFINNDYFANDQEGMSLRDHFAGLAMQALSAHPESLVAIRLSAEQAGITAPEMMARTAYGIADAMIAERNRTGGG